MPASAHTSRTGTRSTTVASSAILLAMLLAAGAAAPAALSAPDSNKVTICHRTHAVTNPYRMITVSANAADGVGNSDHTGHDLAYAFEGVTYPIFTPSVSYPSNAKHWGDIIPPVRNSAGLNWSVPGAQEIYSGTGSSFGLCGRLSAKQFYDLEVAAGIDPAEVLADLDEQGSLEDAALKQQLGITSFSELDPSNFPAGFETVPPAPVGARPPVGFVAEAGKQKIAVLVWFDDDRDGAVDEGELPAPGVTVSLGEVLAVASAGVAGGGTLVMTAGDYVTGPDGLVIVDTIAAGQWDAVATVPSETAVTYDSEGTSDDGRAQVDVPADSAGFAWIGLVSTATPPGGGTDGNASPEAELAEGPELAATGAPTGWGGLLAIGTALVLLGFAAVRTRSVGRGLSDAR